MTTSFRINTRNPLDLIMEEDGSLAFLIGNEMHTLTHEQTQNLWSFLGQFLKDVKTEEQEQEQEQDSEHNPDIIEGAE